MHGPSRILRAGRAAIYDYDEANAKASRYLAPGGAPTETLTLFSPDGAGESWEVVEGFPAGVDPPPGVEPADWDADGDRVGRHLCALADGRVVLTWAQAHDPHGIWYNVSATGRSWDPAKSVRVLEGVPVMGRYQSPRTAQLDAGTLATVCLSVEGGVFVVKVGLDTLE